MIRSDASALIGLTEIPEPAAICFGCRPFSVSMTVFAFVASGLVLDARVQILRVLADDDDVDVLVAGAHPGIRLARAQARVQLELVAESDVDGAEAGPDRRRDRPLQRDAVLLDRVERLVGERRPGLLHHVDAGLAHVPVELDSGRLEDASRRLGELGAGPVPGDEGHAMAHGRAGSYLQLCLSVR